MRKRERQVKNRWGTSRVSGGTSEASNAAAWQRSAGAGSRQQAGREAGRVVWPGRVFDGWVPVVVSRTLILGRLLLEERLVDVRDDATARDGRLDERVQLLVTTDLSRRERRVGQKKLVKKAKTSQ